MSRYVGHIRLEGNLDCARHAIRIPAFPTNGHPTFRDRQCAVFGGARYKLVRTETERSAEFIDLDQRKVC